VDWKSYYRRELQTATAPARIRDWLGAERRGGGGEASARGCIASFPHTALEYAGPLHARLVSSLYRRRIQRVVALGVLHGGGVPAIRAALSEATPLRERKDAFLSVRGAFALPGAEVGTPYGAVPVDPVLRRLVSPEVRDAGDLLQSEFSLDTFLAVLRLGADVFGCSPIPVLPLYIGMVRDPAGEDFSAARRLAALLVSTLEEADTAVVATGDLVHYGTAYGDEPPYLTDPSTHFRSALGRLFVRGLASGDVEHAYALSRDVLKNDQREILPVVSAMLGPGATARIEHYELSDYSGILETAAPCLVASVAVTYRPAD
jgi:predicted class III extradiol MEMO1 family dioxygenase